MPAKLYREIRVENVARDANGVKVGLKPGAEVDVVIEAESLGCLSVNPQCSPKAIKQALVPTRFCRTSAALASASRRVEE
jgi:hypothetical protein